MAEIEFDCEEPATGADPVTDAFIRESFEAVDTEVLTRLVEHAFKRMHLADDTYLSIAIVNEDEMERVHIEWMDLPGATDVMSFPMDELEPGTPENPSSGMLGDIILCPPVAARQGADAGHSTLDELCLLTTTVFCTAWATTTAPPKRKLKCSAFSAPSSKSSWVARHRSKPDTRGAAWTFYSQPSSPFSRSA